MIHKIASGIRHNPRSNTYKRATYLPLDRAAKIAFIASIHSIQFAECYKYKYIFMHISRSGDHNRLIEIFGDHMKCIFIAKFMCRSLKFFLQRSRSNASSSLENVAAS
jgi:hypothetical protein